MTPSTTDPSLQAWQTTLAASSTSMVAHLNDELKKNYLQGFADWTISVLAGKIDNSNPPAPPAAYAVVTGPDGFAWLALGTSPVCDMPPVPPNHTKSQDQLDAEAGANHISIGVHLSGDYWSALDDDTCRAPFTTPPMPPGKDWWQKVR